MNLNHMDRRALAAMIFKDQTLNKAPNAPHCLTQKVPLPPNFSIEKLTKTLAQIQHDFNTLNPLGIVEQPYFPPRPQSQKSLIYRQNPRRYEKRPENPIFSLQNDENSRAHKAPASAKLQPKIHQKPPQRDELLSNFDHAAPIPHFVSQSHFAVRPSSNVRKMRVSQQKIYENPPKIDVPEIQFKNDFPLQKLKTEKPQIKQKLQSEQFSPQNLSPSRPQLIILEKALKLRLEAVKRDLRARLALKNQQKNTQIAALRKQLKGLKNGLLDAISAAQKTLSSVLGRAKSVVSDPFAALLARGSKPLQNVDVSADFCRDFQARFLELSAIAGLWQVRGYSDCAGCMRFLGLDATKVRFCVNSYYSEIIEGNIYNNDNKTRRITGVDTYDQQNIYNNNKNQNGIRQNTGRENNENQIEKYIGIMQTVEKGVENQNLHNNIQYNRSICFPCGCSICSVCAVHARGTCPICYCDAERIVEVKSGNSQFGEMLSDKMSKVLGGVREVCAILGDLGTLQCQGFLAGLEGE
ncbi:hypothetical protein SS50377_24948 [Spironucleus salmonicida]|uniref:Uncharacterized protein n=1 Tax=Spironucleus salmonicida TaxID=348837 RepID=V6LID8_9EUKA|nr:hypothetical protein SS50377_24948 [Spironucleus salmonicida]|eukprot:EST43476.1 Hypothetical protein SS50377_16843 [Spironucleus salmonicida]